MKRRDEDPFTILMFGRNKKKPKTRFSRPQRSKSRDPETDWLEIAEKLINLAVQIKPVLEQVRPLWQKSKRK